MINWLMYSVFIQLNRWNNFHFPVFDFRFQKSFKYYFKNECEGLIRFPNARKHLKPRGRRRSGFIVFEHLKPEARVFEISSPTKKVSLNYHLNKFSELRYCFW